MKFLSSAKSAPFLTIRAMDKFLPHSRRSIQGIASLHSSSGYMEQPYKNTTGMNANFDPEVGFAESLCGSSEKPLLFNNGSSETTK